jgi:hypothetical protein
MSKKKKPEGKTELTDEELGGVAGGVLSQDSNFNRQAGMHEEAETKYLESGGTPKRLSKTSRDGAADWWDQFLADFYTFEPGPDPPDTS